MKKKNIFIIVRLLMLGLAVLPLVACVLPLSISKYDSAAPGGLQKGFFSESGQILLVAEERAWFSVSYKVYALEKRGDIWETAFEPFEAVIGRNGFATLGEKREGDGRTPSGVFPLGLAFGYAETVNTRMTYRQALADDIWVDDPQATDYNRWVKQGETKAASYEKMRRDDNLYKYGLVIEYNTRPVIQGHGSAIFFHVWDGKGSTTAGCVAVSEEDMIRILAWLKPEKLPLIIMGQKK